MGMENLTFPDRTPQEGTGGKHFVGSCLGWFHCCDSSDTNCSERRDIGLVSAFQCPRILKCEVLYIPAIERQGLLETGFISAGPRRAYQVE